MLRVLKTGMNFDLLGDVDAPFPDVMKQATQLITFCYGQLHYDSMSETRIRVWTVRTRNPGTTNTPKLCSLPPTTEAFTDNMKRAHMQTCIWKWASEQINQNLTQLNMVGFEKKNLNLYSQLQSRQTLS